MDTNYILKQLSYRLANKLTWYSLWWNQAEFMEVAKEFFTDKDNEDIATFAGQFNTAEEYALEGMKLAEYMWNQSQKTEGAYSYDYYHKCKSRFPKLPTGFGNDLKPTDRIPTNRMKGIIRKLVIQNRVLNFWPESIKWFTDKKFMSCNRGIYLAGQNFDKCGMSWTDFMNKVDEKLGPLYAGENDPREYKFAYQDAQGASHESSIKPYVQNRWGIFREMEPFSEAEKFMIKHFPAALLLDERQKDPMTVESLFNGFNNLKEHVDEWIENAERILKEEDEKLKLLEKR